jgi:voltage-gated potassium channel
VAATTVLLVLVTALAVLDAERGRPGSNIETFDQALSWGAATITTVGYGDLYPTTAEGRLVTLALMIGGIGLLGFVTGSLASWIVEQIGAEDRPAEETRQEVHILLAELHELRSEVAELRDSLAGRDGRSG